MSDAVSPRFTHDCSACLFVGHANDDGISVDVYVCPQHGRPTIVVRYSDDGPDYSSYPLYLRVYSGFAQAVVDWTHSPKEVRS